MRSIFKPLRNFVRNVATRWRGRLDMPPECAAQRDERTAWEGRYAEMRRVLATTTLPA